MEKQTVFFDMDNVLVDFQSGIDRLDTATRTEYEGSLDEVPGIFSLMKPLDGAVESVYRIAEKYDTFILSTAPWLNPSAWADKIMWIHKYFGSDEKSVFYKKVIITHRKNLCIGDFLIDDRQKWGANLFGGEFLHFGSARFPNWPSVTSFLLDPEREIAWDDVRELIKHAYDNDTSSPELAQSIRALFDKRVVFPDVWPADEVTIDECVRLAHLFYQYVPDEGASYAAARKLRFPLDKAAHAYSLFKANLLSDEK